MAAVVTCSPFLKKARSPARTPFDRAAILPTTGTSVVRPLIEGAFHGGVLGMAELAKLPALAAR
ncbi:MAG: hypothetical protein KY460_07320, partial [Actinobacteria bacterium]|nr:hypothetical protein [Actinomycetota bacterium]